MTSKEIENKIKTFAEEVFGYNLKDYQSFKKREVVGLIYVNKKDIIKLENTFLALNRDALELAKVINVLDNTLKDSVAAYSTKERLINSAQSFNERSEGFKINIFGNFDLFYLNSSLLKKSEKTIDLIIIHEMCHMLVDSGYYKKIKLRPDKKDKERGETVYSYFQILGDPIVHNELFCNLLSAAIKIIHADNTINKLYAALKYNFGYSAETSKKTVMTALKKLEK